MSKGIVFKTRNNEKIYPCPYFPIGSIYLSVSNINPGSVFGGSWEQIKDKFLLTAGNTYSAGTTGGNTSHSHKLSSNGYAEISLHGAGEVKYHELNNNTGVSNWTANFQVKTNQGGSISQTSSWGASLGGNTDSASSLPPYLVVYAWKRVS